MPNFFKPTNNTLAVTTPDTTFQPVMKGEPGLIGRWRLRHRENAAKLTVQEATIDVIEREALATVKNVVEAQGQEMRAEHARVHAQVITAIGDELTANAAAGYQEIGSTRFAATLTNLEMRSEWLAEVERVAAAGSVSAADKESLINTARALHEDVEELQDAVYEGSKGMVKRAYDAACATSTQIINR